MPCSQTPDGVAFASIDSLGHITSLISLEVLSLKGAIFLEAAVLSDDWILRMQNRAFIREAHYTTHIEGTELTLTEAEQIFAGEKLTSVSQDDSQELLNYKDAFEFVSDYLNEGAPVVESLIREIHRKLVNNVRGNSAAPGEYRKIQNYVINSKSKEVIYTPPPAYEVPIMMNGLIGLILGKM